jgi:hypothetical protein
MILFNAKKQIPFFILISFLFFSCSNSEKNENISKNESHPRIVNIINFIRLSEPREADITEEVLYETVVKQVQSMNQYNLGGTFLLQYDALLDTRYQQLLKSLPKDTFEVGAWWEIPQPLVENAGLKWRGRFSWDWHADVGFSTGYSPLEREKLVDVYMEDFKQVFGYYPKSVGSWFIDAHTLNYMHQKYNIVASCNCKDQIGTDGYSMWGGYWNQGYYPSKKNAYMPAQNEINQIPVPVFRMLGSDPIRQYDAGLGSQRQHVVSLEPVYSESGADSAWVNWYFNQFVEGECMEYAYAQVGQENSFTWDQMSKGFEMQLPLIARLRDEKKVQVETLTESGQWFRKNFKTTPPTSVTVKKDFNDGTSQTVWFNSRFYRVNLLWENSTLRFRDMHIFNENLASDYVFKKGTSNKCSFYTLPFIDGFSWSSIDNLAGLRFKTIVNGEEIPIEGGIPTVNDSIQGKLIISWPLTSISGVFVIDIDENRLEIKYEGKNASKWFLDFTAMENAKLPFHKITPKHINCQFLGMKYSIELTDGNFSEPGNGIIYRINPANNRLTLNLSQKITIE